MRIKTVTVSAGLTCPNPEVPYGSVKAHCQLEMEIIDGDDYGIVMLTLQDAVDNAVLRHVAKLTEKVNS